MLLVFQPVQLDSFLLDELVEQQLDDVVPVQDDVLHQDFQNFRVLTSQLFRDGLLRLSIFHLKHTEGGV